MDKTLSSQRPRNPGAFPEIDFDEFPQVGLADSFGMGCEDIEGIFRYFIHFLRINLDRMEM